MSTSFFWTSAVQPSDTLSVAAAASVRPIVIYWDVFSSVLQSLIGESGRVSGGLPDSQLDRLLALYRRAVAHVHTTKRR